MSGPIRCEQCVAQSGVSSEWVSQVLAVSGPIRCEQCVAESGVSSKWLSQVLIENDPGGVRSGC